MPKRVRDDERMSVTFAISSSYDFLPGSPPPVFASTAIPGSHPKMGVACRPDESALLRGFFSGKVEECGEFKLYRGRA